MFVTAQVGLDVAQLQLNLATQQLNEARDGDTVIRLTKWVEHCKAAVAGWEEILRNQQARRAAGAFGG